MKKRARRFYWARMASHSTSIDWETRTSFTFSLEVFVMKWIYTPVLALTIAALLGSVPPAAAHHSGAGFNSGKIIELKGTVKEFLPMKCARNGPLPSLAQPMSKNCSESSRHISTISITFRLKRVLRSYASSSVPQLSNRQTCPPKPEAKEDRQPKVLWSR